MTLLDQVSTLQSNTDYSWSGIAHTQVDIPDKHFVSEVPPQHPEMSPIPIVIAINIPSAASQGRPMCTWTCKYMDCARPSLNPRNMPSRGRLHEFQIHTPSAAWLSQLIHIQKLKLGRVGLVLNPVPSTSSSIHPQESTEPSANYASGYDEGKVSGQLVFTLYRRGGYSELAQAGEFTGKGIGRIYKRSAVAGTSSRFSLFSIIRPTSTSKLQILLFLLCFFRPQQCFALCGRFGRKLGSCL